MQARWLVIWDTPLRRRQESEGIPGSFERTFDDIGESETNLTETLPVAPPSPSRGEQFHSGDILTQVKEFLTTWRSGGPKSCQRSI